MYISSKNILPTYLSEIALDKSIGLETMRWIREKAVVSEVGPC